jgi:hypothetical protein
LAAVLLMLRAADSGSRGSGDSENSADESGSDNEPLSVSFAEMAKKRKVHALADHPTPTPTRTPNLNSNPAPNPSSNKRKLHTLAGMLGCSIDVATANNNLGNELP